MSNELRSVIVSFELSEYSACISCGYLCLEKRAEAVSARSNLDITGRRSKGHQLGEAWPLCASGGDAEEPGGARRDGERPRSVCRCVVGAWLQPLAGRTLQRRSPACCCLWGRRCWSSPHPTDGLDTQRGAVLLIIVFTLGLFQ